MLQCVKQKTNISGDTSEWWNYPIGYCLMARQQEKCRLYPYLNLLFICEAAHLNVFLLGPKMQHVLFLQWHLLNNMLSVLLFFLQCTEWTAVAHEEEQVIHQSDGRWFDCCAPPYFCTCPWARYWTPNWYIVCACVCQWDVKNFFSQDN